MPDYELALALGIFGGLLIHELTGFSAGGLVTSGYLAVFLDQPFRLAGTLIVSLFTWGGVRLLSSFFIIFGRRRFAVAVLLGFLLRWLWQLLLSQPPLEAPELKVIGFIIPGLIANEMLRQGVLVTLAVLILAASLVRLALMALQGLGL